ncbi:DegT/DnrJ/EryC1/StrS family aminotransferase [bacterium D16-54]|nr:DegT/DnrJ/EryC1/StrS family aminotransferase [bacterium D16-54]RKJ13389.1 DegT/DnrJ/EryC1/StrS family aminotransferase [bacterium D16-56]
MKFIDLEKQYCVIKNNVEKRIHNILEKQDFIMGSEIQELEQKLADFTGRKYCITCGSGTEALQIPMMAYNLSKTDAVFVPSFTFFASAESINLAGGTPVFTDIDHTFNMDPRSLESEIKRVIQEGKLTPKGIVSVDLFGRSADYEQILKIADRYGLFLLEDAAQGFGGSLHKKRNGSFGDVSATSFFPAKPLGCYGDGGAIFTDDDALYEKMCSIRVHGQGADKYDNIRIGINGRMDTLQAAILLEKLDIFEDELIKRQHVAEWYSELLEGILELPQLDDEYFSSWAQYTIRAENETQRDYLVSELKKRDIPTMIYYPIPLHMQTAYKNLGYGNENLPYCLHVSKRVFSIPMHPYLKKTEVEMICQEIKQLVK